MQEPFILLRFTAAFILLFILGRSVLWHIGAHRQIIIPISQQ